MFKYAILFIVLGFFFPPLWILAFIFTLGSLFGDIGKIIIAVIAFPFKLIGLFRDDEEEEKIKVIEKETVIDRGSSLSGELEKLSALYKEGHISEDEYNTAKKKILNPYTRD